MENVGKFREALRAIRDAARWVRDDGWKEGDALLRAIGDGLPLIEASPGLPADQEALRASIAEDCAVWRKAYTHASTPSAELQDSAIKLAARLVERCDSLLGDEGGQILG